MLKSNEPSSLLKWLSVLRMVSIATFVLPAPVGAQSNMLESSLNAVGNTLDWILFKVEVSALGNACLAHGGRVDIETNSESSKGFAGAGMCISS